MNITQMPSWYQQGVVSTALEQMRANEDLFLAGKTTEVGDTDGDMELRTDADFFNMIFGIVDVIVPLFKD
jgi:hypothetical protein